MSEAHSKNIQTAIINLAASVAGAVGYIEEQISMITEGIMQYNPDKMKIVHDYTKNVRKLTFETIQKTLETFVIYKPKGHDAKFILVSWRIATALERISILLSQIADQSSDLNLNDIQGAKTAFVNIQNSLMSQTYNMVITYTAEKKELIQDIITKETHIQNIYKSFFKEMIINLIENPKLISKTEKALHIAKLFEMVASYMREIAEHLIYKYNL
jgi:phosphate transport system protein